MPGKAMLHELLVGVGGGVSRPVNTNKIHCNMRHKLRTTQQTMKPKMANLLKLTGSFGHA